MNDNRRRFPRHPFAFPIHVAKKEEEFIVTHSTDVSMGGLCFYWNEPLEEGEEIDVSIPIEKNTYNMDSKVAYACPDREQNGRYRIGVAFCSENRSFRESLAKEALDFLDFYQKLTLRKGRQISEEDAAREWFEKKPA